MARPEIVIIAAVAEKNRVIGMEGKLPWYISEDLCRFKQLTLGNPVLMGRKTFESILVRLGKPLPERRSLVLTKHRRYPEYREVEKHRSIESALTSVSEEAKLFVIGGETVFLDMLPRADKLELTMVEGNYEGDAFFPEYEHLISEKFQLLESEERDDYRFETYVANPEHIVRENQN